MKYKIGDKVKRLNCDFLNCKVGSIYTISSIQSLTLCFNRTIGFYDKRHFILIMKRKKLWKME